MGVVIAGVDAAELAGDVSATVESRSVLALETYAGLLRELELGWNRLPDKPEETPEGVLRALWFTAAGEPRSCKAASCGELPILSDTQADRLRQLMAMRKMGVPVAHLTQRQNFMGMELLVGPEALIPRKETEILAVAAIGKIRDMVARDGSVRVLDLCTGCGNLALAYARYVEGCFVHGADLSAEAIALARRNAAHARLEDHVMFQCGDLTAPFEREEFLGGMDLISCNPPYICSTKVGTLPPEIADHEPDLAFDGGPFGLDIIMRMLAEAPRLLKPGGWLGFEVGVGQGSYLLRYLRSTGAFAETQAYPDAAGRIRAIFARV